MNILNWLLWPLRFNSFSILGSIGSAIGGAFGGSLGNKLFGPSRGRQKRDARKAQENTLQQVRLGNDLDLRNQKQMFDYRINQGTEAGMTPYEMFMGPAAGAGGGTTGSGNTLGNAANSQSIAMEQRQQDNRLRMQQMGMQAGTQLATANIQADAQRDVAKISAGVTERGQDVNKQIADNILALDKQRLQNETKKVAAQVKVSEQELLYKINQTATSDPKFMTAMKQLSMGPANLLVELTLRHHGIQLSDQSFMNMSHAQRVEILQELTALASNAYVEGKGVAALGSDVSETSLTNKAIDSILGVLGIDGGPSIEQVQPSTPQLGKPFKPPRSYKRRGYAGPQPFKTN